MEKKCNRCNEIKPLNEFHKLSSSSDGRKQPCKECRKVDSKNDYWKDPVKSREKAKQQRLSNIEHYLKKEQEYRDKSDPEKVREYNNQYREKNREKILAQKRQHYYDNKETILGKQKIYNKKNPRTEYYRNYVMNKYRTNLAYRLQSQIAHRIREAIKYQNANKVKGFNRTHNIVGCTVEELKQHLEAQFQEGMSWDNWTNDGWHIDHIVPCITFDLTDPEQQKLCFHYTNLQPLWAEENLKKSKKLPHEWMEEIAASN